MFQLKLSCYHPLLCVDESALGIVSSLAPPFCPLIPSLFRSDVKELLIQGLEYSTCKKDLRKMVLFSSRKEAKGYPIATCSDLKSGYKDNSVFSVLAQTIQGVTVENNRKWKVLVGN